MKLVLVILMLTGMLFAAEVQTPAVDVGIPQCQVQSVYHGLFYNGCPMGDYVNGINLNTFAGNITVMVYCYRYQIVCTGFNFLAKYY